MTFNRSGAEFAHWGGGHYPSAVSYLGLTFLLIAAACGHEASPPETIAPPVAPPPERSTPTELSAAASHGLALGGNHSCQRTASGVRCWGKNDDGQVGDGGDESGRRAAVVLPEIGRTLDIAAGRFRTCAATAAGAVACWGSDGFGAARGANGFGAVREPALVEGLTGVTRVAVGEYHSCALLGDGSARCWGRNVHGELGDGSPVESRAPVAVLGVEAATDISAWGPRSCVVMGGRVHCWGQGAYRIANDGSSGHIERPPPTTEELAVAAVPGLDRVVDVEVGPHHACAIRADGSLHCWGADQCGQSSARPPGADASAPVTVAGLSDIVAVALGNGHTCALRSDRSVWCWGCGAGVRGDGAAGSVRDPRPIEGLLADAIASGPGHVCAATTDGGATCWGAGWAGATGDGDPSEEPRLSPVPVVTQRPR